MGFWSGLIKVIQGRPVFEPQSPESQSQETTMPPVGETPVAASVDTSGRKILPEIEIAHVKSHIDEPHMEVRVWATNRSAVEIELDKITIAGVTTETDRILMPGEGREILIYKGSALTDDSHRKATLRYKTRDTGDYFEADYHVEYHHDSRGIYEVEELRPIHPIRDV